MATVLVPGARAMAKAKGRPKTSQRDDKTVRLDRRVAEMAEMVAKHRGLSLAALISEMLRAPVDAAFLEMVEALKARARPKGPK